MLTEEQIINIKRQIIGQIESTFPEDKKEFAIQQIESMDNEQLEEFLKQNGMVQNGQSPQQCIFCSIVSGQINSYKIKEIEEAIAVLEINPVSNGHTIIILKEHLSSKEQFSEKMLSFSKKIAQKIKNSLNSKDVIIASSNLFGHEILNLIPVYTDETINSKRNPAKPEELEAVQKLLTKKEKKIRAPRIKKEKIIKVKKEKTEKKDNPKKSEKYPWLPRRVP